MKKTKQAILTALILGAAAGAFFMLKTPSPAPQVPRSQAPESDESKQDFQDREDTVVVMAEIKKQPPIDYSELEQDAPLKSMMADRKKNLGIKNSLDMIVKSDESFTVGKSTVSMQEILEKAFVGKGEVFQKNVSDIGLKQPGQIKEYGIYVVQPGDNIWNIHFSILKEYYGTRGIILQDLADEPGTGGMSSGVGKILKFSETMVIIYNMVEEKITEDINIIDPLSKIVVYNMDAVFSLLEEISLDNVDRLRFDGKNIWMSAQKN